MKAGTGNPDGETSIEDRRIEKIDPVRAVHWDGWFPPHQDYCFFHSSAWALTLHEAYGFEPFYLVDRSGGRLMGLLPIMEVRSGLSGTRGVSLPFSDFCPPLVWDQAGFGDLLKEAAAYGAVRGWRYLEWRGGCPASRPPASTYREHEIALGTDEAELLGSFHSSIRQGIRKAERSALKVEIRSDTAALSEFYRLHCGTRRKHGLPPQPWRFFAKIGEHVLAEDWGILVLARLIGHPVAAAIFFHIGDKALFKFGASDPRYQSLRPNNLVLWEAIRYYTRRRFNTLHLGRTDLDNEGLRSFKRHWGATERPLYYYQYDLRPKKYFKPRPKTRYTGLATIRSRSHPIFRWLPTPINRLVGSWFYRHWG